MRLAAVYNVWDGEELLEGSIKQIRSHVDIVICVCQELSNYGIFYEGGLKEAQRLKEIGLVDVVDHYIPKGLSAVHKEKAKRKRGLELAAQNHCNYFLFMDCDEYYDTNEFSLAKKEAENYEGTYCSIVRYFTPRLRLEGLDSYVVPFICKVPKMLNVGGNMGHLKQGRDIDPTRGIKCSNLSLLNIKMHHYTSVRKNIRRKYENSSARKNLDINQIVKELGEIKEGSIIKGTNKKVILAKNNFNINESILLQ